MENPLSAAETDTDQLLDAVEELGPLWRQRMPEHDRASTFPYENLAEAKEVGLNRLIVPKEFSCGYASNHRGTAQGAFDFIAGYVAGRDDLSSRSGSTPIDQSAAGA